MKVIGIKTKNRDHAQFVLDGLQDAVAKERVELDDIAMVFRDEEGKLQIQQTGDITPKKGAVRGGLVGALVGLAAPPLLGATVLGAGLGAVWGKLRDKGVDDATMKRVGGLIAHGEAVVFAIGPDASLQAVAERVQEVMGDEMETFVIGAEDESVLREAATDGVEAPSG